MVEKILWQPSESQIAATNLHHFSHWLAQQVGKAFPDYASLHQFSCENLEQFWFHFWDYAGVIGTKGAVAVSHPNKMPHAGFFPQATLNFAENILCSKKIDRDQTEVFFKGETGKSYKKSHAILLKEAMQLARKLETLGVKPGDRVAAFMPNIPETVVAMLATSSIGAVFTSCSPDFGVAGVLDRFGQTAPKVLIACDGYYYGGKEIDSLPKIADIVSQLPSLLAVVVVPFLHAEPNLSMLAKNKPQVILWGDGLAGQDATPRFTPLPFDHPLFIMYSSGTTGVPKCIVHGAGGTLLKFMVEQTIHCDLKPRDKIFFFSTCGWMMWNWLLGCLHTGASLALFDGSPLYPTPSVLWDYADEYGFSHFGTSAKYIDSIKKSGYRPTENHSFPHLRMVLTTGSPLLPESFDFIYEAVKPTIQVASISGGTDILGCFLAGNPTQPVVRGELQCPVLGMAVAALDEAGQQIKQGRGELACTKPFPSMPIYFWNDADGQKYKQAYFDRYPNVWYHGDFLEITPTGYVIHGRSDATLNPGGVRIGTAEIYRQVEQLPAIAESIVIGQDWQGDTRVVLFVKLQDGVGLDEALINVIKKKIRDNCSPRHVPAKILAVADIPRTKSGKITELAVRDVVMGKEVKNKEALLNPEALLYFKHLPALQV